MVGVQGRCRLEAVRGLLIVTAVPPTPPVMPAGSSLCPRGAILTKSIHNI